MFLKFFAMKKEKESLNSNVPNIYSLFGREFVGQFLPCPWDYSKCGFQYALKDGVITVQEPLRFVRIASDEERKQIADTLNRVERAYSRRFLNCSDL